MYEEHDKKILITCRGVATSCFQDIRQRYAALSGKIHCSAHIDPSFALQADGRTVANGRPWSSPLFVAVRWRNETGRVFSLGFCAL